MNAAIERLRAEGRIGRDIDLGHLSPALYGHVNPYGKYRFEIEGRAPGLRPLKESGKRRLACDSAPLLSLWLPIGVVVLSVIRFGFDPSFSTGFVPMLFSLPAMVFGLVFAWPGGIPLTRALERLHPVSRPATYACAAVLCPLSVGAATIGGLFGPPGIWIYAGIVSLPAWLVLWLLRWRARRLAALGGSEQGEAGLS